MYKVTTWSANGLARHNQEVNFFLDLHNDILLIFGTHSPEKVTLDAHVILSTIRNILVGERAVAQLSL